MKVKANKPLPHFDSYCGLGVEDWEKLNNGEVVELKKVPAKAKEYLQEVKIKKEKIDG